MSRVVYFDYAATTPVDKRVAERMAQYLTVDGTFGNPASRSHWFGWQAEEAVEIARSQLAAVLNADPREVVFTSGATESDNLAIKGVIEAGAKKHIITSTIEHKAVLDTCAYLETHGATVTWLSPGPGGQVSPEAVAEAIRPDTAIVSLMHVNNELGSINDIAAIGAVCRSRGVVFHTDAAQSFGKLAIDVQALPVDLVSISGHKIYGPKGIGALYVKREPPVRCAPQIHGGGHEMGFRSGTLATHQIVGLGEAAMLMGQVMVDEQAHLGALRERLWSHLQQVPGVHLNGSADRHIAGILNVGFAGVDGETLLLALDDVALSSGSACTSASVEPSYVLRAIGVPDDLAHSSLRFSLGRYTSEADVDFAATRVADVVTKLRRD